jgi:hypothetical protein
MKGETCAKAYHSTRGYSSVISTKIVVGLGIVLLFLAIGMDWLIITFSFSASNQYVNVFDLAYHINPYIIYHNLPPNDTTDGQIWSILAPQLTVGWFLVAEWSFPIALVLSVLALFRWKLALPSGAAAIASGTVWIFGIDSIRLTLATGLSHLQSFVGQDGRAVVNPSLGAYVTILGGVVLVVGYILSITGKLDTPI